MEVSHLHEVQPGATLKVQPVGLSLRPELLQRRVAELCWEIFTEAQAQLVHELTEAFAKIDRAVDEALVVPWLRPGAPPEEVEAIVAQAAVVKEVVKAPLLQRLADLWEHDTRVRLARTEAERRRRKPSVHAVGVPVVTPVVVRSEDKQPDRWQQWAH